MQVHTLGGAMRLDQLERLGRAVGFPAVEKKSDNPVRIGILGASSVATYAMMWPAKRLDDVEVVAVAARDASRAAQYARRHGVPKSYGAYEELISDPSLDAVYVALPNGMHGEWTRRALQAGKHVLCEKPFTANSAEARSVHELSWRKGLLAREAFHYKEHPANQQVAALVRGGAIGRLTRLDARVLIPKWVFGAGDIRFNPKLAGGTMMDAGCYCAHALRFFAGMQPRVVSAQPHAVVGPVDLGMSATVAYPVSDREVVGTLEASLAHPGLLPVSTVHATGTEGEVVLRGFVTPFIGHDIELTTRSAATGAGTTTHYRAYGSGESNYHFQLQRFVTDLKVLRGGEGDAGGEGDVGLARAQVRRAMRADAVDAIRNMQLIDAVYSAARLPLRVPTAQWRAAE